MIGNWIKYSSEHSLNGDMHPDSIEVIKLTEPHEIGEIINDYWLILSGAKKTDNGIYETGTYVRIIDIRYLDIFETDLNYDYRNDLRKYAIEKIVFNNHIVTANRYKFIGI
jgi:hypothetical protein